MLAESIQLSSFQRGALYRVRKVDSSRKPPLFYLENLVGKPLSDRSYYAEVDIFLEALNVRVGQRSCFGLDWLGWQLILTAIIHADWAKLSFSAVALLSRLGSVESLKARFNSERALFFPGTEAISRGPTTEHDFWGAGHQRNENKGGKNAIPGIIPRLS